MKPKSIRNVMSFVLILSILVAFAASSATIANGEVSSTVPGVSGEYRDITGGFRLWRGDVAYNILETGVIDTAILKIKPQGLGDGIHITYANSTFLDPEKTIIKLTKLNTTSPDVKTGFVYNYYKWTHYGFVCMSSFGEFYLDVEAYDYDGNKYFKRTKIICELLR